MRVIGVDHLCQSCTQADAHVGRHLWAWLAEVRAAGWKNYSEIRRSFPNVRTLKNGHMSFELAGAQIVLVALVNFETQVVLITEIMEIDAARETRSAGGLA